MAEVSQGRVSSMPGSRHALPAGATCDRHQDRPAVARVQGETDSFGCEYNDMCQECVDEHRAFIEAELNSPKYCCWCKQMKLHVSPHRDFEEGTSGPLYDVCADCRSEENKRAVAELEESGRYSLSSYDADEDDDFDYDRHYGRGR